MFNGCKNAKIRCGYLYKSPPKTALRLEWKRRYFMLFKTIDQNYQLRYFRSAEEKGQALGGIDLTQISLIYGNPQHHQKWIWVQRTFKCSPSCVLYIRAGTRDYFLVGETRLVSCCFSGPLLTLTHVASKPPPTSPYFVVLHSTIYIKNNKLKSIFHFTRIGFCKYLNDRTRIFLIPFIFLSSSTPEERNFMVMQSDLKKHLTLTDVEGKPSVSGWTGQPQSVCLFHKGDQVLAINDLHTSTVEEVNMFISRSLKNEVKVTILRQRGRQPLHLPNSPCSD
uniref:Uncharacterized protein n=1 Tax=Fundulus heteroclitus TaxID=8078 RepID=A0A3Q2T2V5_FUNHE